MKKGRCYLDTSVLFKRYFREKGQEEAHALMEEAGELLISELGIPELFSAFRRLVREGHLNEGQYLQAKEAIGQDLSAISIIPLDAKIVREAIGCLEKAALQGADSIHVATALVHGCDFFASADQQQCAAAKKIGLTVKTL